MKIHYLLLIVPVIGICPLKAMAQGHTERGAVIGGLGGALAGAAIGKHNGETAVGALIGGAAGLIAGSAIGEAKDRDDARRQAIYYHQAQQQAQVVSRAVSTQDVVTMTHRGVDPQIIVTQIRQNGVTRRLEVSDVIALHQQGVSEYVITAMQNARVATVVPAPVYSPAPVVVEQHHHYVAPPRYYRPHYHPRASFYYHHHH